MAAQQEVKHSVLPSKLGGGPKGLGTSFFPPPS